MNRGRSKQRSAWRLGVLGVLALLGISNAAAEDVVVPAVSTLRLKAETTIQDQVATLGDVLSFADADSRLTDAIAARPLFEASTDVNRKPRAALPANSVSHEQIVERLSALGVNMARVLVTGAAMCDIRYAVQPATPAAPAATKDDAAQLAASDAEAPLVRDVSGVGDQKSLADVLRRLIADDVSSLGGKPEVEFEVAGREFLTLTTPPFDFSVAGGRGPTLGVREFKVTIRRDGKVQRTVRIGANVKLVREVLVASKPLNIGAYISRDSVDVAPRVFTASDDLGLVHAEQVVGQQTQAFVPAGQMLRSKDVKSVDMVKRSRPVTVEGNGSVSLRLTGVAIDNGGYGETVRVRLGDSRRDRREIRGVVTGVGVVRMEE